MDNQMTDKTDMKRKISKRQFSNILSNQIQILQNIQSQAKSIVNLTLAILTAAVSIGTTDIITIPSFSFPSDNSIQEAVSGTIVAAESINGLISVSVRTILLSLYIIILIIPIGYIKIISVLKAPVIKPIISESEYSGPIELVDSDKVDYDKYQIWIQHNTSLLEEMGEKYQRGIQSIAVGVGIAVYCVILLISAIELNILFLVVMNIALASALISYVMGTILYWYSQRGSDDTAFSRIVQRRIRTAVQILLEYGPVPVLVTIIIPAILIVILQLHALYIIIRYGIFGLFLVTVIL